VDLLDALYDVLVAMIATVLTAGIAAAQGTETHRPVPSAVPIALPGEGLTQHPFLYCGRVAAAGSRSSSSEMPSPPGV